jgi:lipopolysaccharide transport protein LptA
MALVLTLLAAAPSGLPPGPVDFSAREMRFEAKDRRVLYLDGEVHLNRGDLTVLSDHAVADLADEHRAKPPPKNKKSKKARKKADAATQTQEIEKFTVDGNVHVSRGDRTADGEHGVVDMSAQTLVLTGTKAAPPILHDGPEILEGERILLHTDTDDVDVQKPHLVLHRALAEKALPDGDGPVPMRVDADRLVLHNQAKLARFTDDVVVHRGDAVMRSPQMDARYGKDGELTVLQLRGGVDLRQGDRRATGESADYDAKARTMVLLGDPKLYDRGDVLVGDRIELSLDSSEVRVSRGRARLRPEAHKDENSAEGGQ